MQEHPALLAPQVRRAGAGEAYPMRQVRDLPAWLGRHGLVFPRSEEAGWWPAAARAGAVSRLGLGWTSVGHFARLEGRPRAKDRVHQIVLTGNPDQGEQRITAGIGQGGAKPMGCSRLADRADRPVRGHPFARGVDKCGGEADQAYPDRLRSSARSRSRAGRDTCEPDRGRRPAAHSERSDCPHAGRARRWSQ